MITTRQRFDKLVRLNGLITTEINILSNMLQPQKTPGEIAAEIVRFVEKYYSMQPTDIYQRTRRREIVVPRQMAMLLVRKITKWSSEKTGLYFRMDHATVLHAARTINDLCQVDKKFREEFNLVSSLTETHIENFCNHKENGTP